MNRGFIILIIFALLCGLGLWRFLLEMDRISRQPITAWLEDHSADCAVVLTGSSGRVREGFDLLSRKSIKKLIISGVHPTSNLREIFPRWPFYGNLKKEDVILEKQSSTTYGNAQQSLPLVEALNCRDVVVITSRLHLYRAKKMFNKIYPPEISIYYRSVLSGRFKVDLSDLSIESLKSLFYSIWAY